MKRKKEEAEEEERKHKEEEEKKKKEKEKGQLPGLVGQRSVNLTTYRALYSFVARNADELSIDADGLIEVCGKNTHNDNSGLTNNDSDDAFKDTEKDRKQSIQAIIR